MMLRSFSLIGAILLARGASLLSPCISNEKGNSGVAMPIASGWCCPAQTFTAVHTGPLERIDARLSGSGCQARLRIREDEWGDVEVGASLPAAATSGPTVFTFDPPLQMVAGKVYTIDPEVLGGSCTWIYYSSDDLAGAKAGGYCPKGGCSSNAKEYAFTIYCPSGETPAPALPPCEFRAKETNTIASTYHLGSSSDSFALKAGYRFVQEFRATETGLPTELGIHMGSNQNPYTVQLRFLTTDGEVLLDETFTGRKQRYSDWATMFPLTNLWNTGVQLVAGTWYKFDIVVTSDRDVGIRPIKQGGEDYKTYSIPGYGNIASAFFLHGNPCSNCAPVRIIDASSPQQHTDVSGQLVTSSTVDAGSLVLADIPNALTTGSSSLFVPSTLPVPSSSTIKLHCCGTSECTFSVSLYRCPTCSQKDGGLARFLASSSPNGWTGSSCAPTFGGSDRHPMVTFSRTFSAGESEELPLTSDASFLAVFVTEGTLPSDWCPKLLGPGLPGSSYCSLNCA